MVCSSSPILGVLLAGGRSQRMATDDKCLVELAGKPLLAHAVERITPQVDSLVLNANGDPDRFSAFRLPVVPDTIDGFAGPLAGILAGMLWVRAHMAETRLIVCVATDTPFFPANLVSHLLAGLNDSHEIAISRYGGQDFPVFGLFPVALADDLDSFLRNSENFAVKAWLDRHRTVSVDFDQPSEGASNPFLNINTPEDLRVAECATGSAIRQGS